MFQDKKEIIIVKSTRKCIQKHPFYNTYRGMKERCYYNKKWDYKYYGGKDIKVCDRWLESFWNFVEDMGDRPEGYTLDRIDSNKDYSPENCRWASKFTQTQNHGKCTKAKNYGILKCGNNIYYRVHFRRNNIIDQTLFKTETEAINYVAQLRKNYAETH